MKTPLAAVSLLSVAAVSLLAGQDDEYSRKTLVGLGGVYVLVEEVGDSALRDGLSKQQLRTDVELRLREAGILVLTEEQTLAKESGAYLYVYIHAVNSSKGFYAVHVRVELKQRVKLIRNSSIIAVAPTWSAAPITGMVGSAYLSSSMRDKVRDMTDQFINTYLAANPRK